jgi:hypothetical protein
MCTGGSGEKSDNLEKVMIQTLFLSPYLDYC